MTTEDRWRDDYNNETRRTQPRGRSDSIAAAPTSNPPSPVHGIRPRTPRPPSLGMVDDRKPDHGAAAFAALGAIQAGEWDRYLLRLQSAIRARRDTDAYRDHIIAGDE